MELNGSVEAPVTFNGKVAAPKFGVVEVVDEPKPEVDQKAVLSVNTDEMIDNKEITIKYDAEKDCFTKEYKARYINAIQTGTGKSTRISNNLEI
ncbi:unnamed protein product [Sphagnum balticum]